MDVVYNHTFSTSSCLNKIVPGYYYRTDDKGNFTNGSGCGNETASERSMVRKYIVDSVVYWASEYKIDGYRFDLMGVHDIATMCAVRASLDKIDPTIMVYGEGWTGGTSALSAGDSAIKANVGEIEGVVGAFSDDIRDGAKGSVFDSADVGFATGSNKITRKNDIMFGITAAVEHPQTDLLLLNHSSTYWAPTPEHFISYVECHDNLTLWDKIVISRPDASVEDQVKMDKLAATISLTGQGVHFLQLGQDFLRSKDGDANSYRSSNEVNNIDWNVKSENSEVYDYYKGLISLHKSTKAFNLETAEAVAECIVFDETTGEGVVAFTINQSEKHGVDRTVAVIHNATSQPLTYTLPDGLWEIYADGTKAGTEVLGSASETVTIPALSSYILMKSDDSVKTFFAGSAPGTFRMGGFLLFCLTVIALAAIAFAGSYAVAKHTAGCKAETCECACCACEADDCAADDTVSADVSEEKTE